MCVVRLLCAHWYVRMILRFFKVNGGDSTSRRELQVFCKLFSALVGARQFATFWHTHNISSIRYNSNSQFERYENFEMMKRVWIKKLLAWSASVVLPQVKKA